MKQQRPDQESFRLPTDVTATKEQLAAGLAYVLRHRTLGLLGRLVLQDREDGRCQVSCEVAGDPEDPMTAQRFAVLQPLTTALIQRLEAQPGPPVTAPHRPPPPRPAGPDGEWVESKLVQCERCTAGVALLIFAVQATDQGGLEDYARKRYRQVVRLNLPTYVIGPALGEGPLLERPADILKIWPEREPIQRLRPDEFNPIIAALARSHCR